MRVVFLRPYRSQHYVFREGDTYEATMDEYNWFQADSPGVCEIVKEVSAPVADKSVKAPARSKARENKQ